MRFYVDSRMEAMMNLKITGKGGKDFFKRGHYPATAADSASQTPLNTWIKIADFGFAKHCTMTVWTLRGTSDYLAPELTGNVWYNNSVDWYALGVLIFKMLSGLPLFHEPDISPVVSCEKIAWGLACIMAGVQRKHYRSELKEYQVARTVPANTYAGEHANYTSPTSALWDPTAPTASMRICQQISPILDQSTGRAVPDVMQSYLHRIHEGQAIGNRSDSRSTSSHGSDNDLAVKIEDNILNALGQLALDEHGHPTGNSSTMSSIQQLKKATTSPLHCVKPIEEDPLAPGPSVNKLSFPTSVYFGKVRALPRLEGVEYPERGLVDKFVGAYFARFHFLMPILDNPDFMRQYRYLLDRPVLSRFVDDLRLKTTDHLKEAGMGMVYHERALILHYISAASMQVEHVQCFLLMSSFLCPINGLSQAWL
ncbi:hypothetical protein DICSQDRAFT_181859 [Dichomitus squalens LYAD-421 SS1]|uniref:cAMP-dependent protein kinase n=1 Tax=Dichomitus squalens (strain LYAD-421) TaxID=732165 RepID=R7STD5_DICSQ|nr:uncharacterized protein DICSQDRAFT_181859 [Dichomitus squalens LYAD-421 SS1]EJF59494.1 hypothetical protein DICSQDRAFT_181859 [Dichomitus squalens LYAD-421 SS1]